MSLAGPRTGEHGCPAPGCRVKSIPASRLACPEHYQALSPTLQQRVRDYFRKVAHGLGTQEGYLVLVRDCIEEWRAIRPPLAN